METNQQSFWKFSDQLRSQTSNLANVSVNDSIWSSSSYPSKKTEDRKNFDTRVGGEVNYLPSQGSDLNEFNDGWNSLKPIINGSDLNAPWNVNRSSTSLSLNSPYPNRVEDGWNSFNLKGSDYNGFNDGWKMGPQKGSIGINGGFTKGVYSKPGYYSNFISSNNNMNNTNSLKGYKNSGKGEQDEYGVKSGKKNNSNKKNNGADNSDCKDKDGNKNGVDKRFKTLPVSESLPRNETIGGYIFVCNNDTMQENLKRELFGLPPRYRDSVRAITPGLPLFLYNYSTHQLHGIFEAASFGGTNIDPTAWEDKKCPGESRFPAQVRVMTRKICEPLEEDSFRPILHHYDGPKFRLELNIPEALSLLDIFAEENP